MKNRSILLLLFAAVLVLIVIGVARAFDVFPSGILAGELGNAALPTPTAIPIQANRVTEAAQVESAIREAITGDVHSPILFMYETDIDHVEISPDATWSTAWMTPIDPITGEVVPAEPGLVILRKEAGEWQTYLPSDANWTDLLQDLPTTVLSDQEKADWIEMYEADNQLAARAMVSGPLSGYYLPWSGGRTLYLTQSVGHDRYDSSMKAHYAFDFSSSPSALWDIYAARSGTVWRARWTCDNGNENCGNYLVLQDTTTTPTTYMLYLHLAQNSIPEALRVVGAPVAQGQFLGVADDTGKSSNHHLHFHVHTNPDSYWGQSIDIVFSDVDINGGRPRIASDRSYCRNDSTYQDVCTSTRSAYLSGNISHQDLIAPSGGILAPTTGSNLGSTTLHLQGWATDEGGSGLAAAQFKAFYNDTWHDVGSSFTTALFEMDWDMCAAGVPDGPVSLALWMRDQAYNITTGLPGLTHVSKNAACPAEPPPCQPTDTQVALFSQPGFTGSCQVFGLGSFSSTTSFGNLGLDEAESIQVGRSVMAAVYEDALAGRSESFLAEDSNLSDNRIGANTISSLKVVNRARPTAPVLSQPAQSAQFSTEDSILLTWADKGGAAQLQATLTGNGQTTTSPLGPQTSWVLGSLGPGSYTWKVKAVNLLGETSSTETRTFTVQSTQGVVGANQTAPFNDAMEAAGSLWSSSGQWKQSNRDNHTSGGALSWSYDVDGASYNSGSTNTGSLTSPSISIPDANYHLRFWYLYDTEGSGQHWDQRWVQVSVDGGPFTNLVQLTADPSNYWLQGPVLSMAQYAGHTVRIRFFFTTVDASDNLHKGWLIDDVSITTEAPPSCGDENNSPATAQEIVSGSPIDANICPGGDIDYYKFSGAAGDRIGALVEAQFTGSALDPSLALLDSDGASILASQDDLVLTELIDASVNQTLAATRTYYLRVSAWDHPSGGSASHSYRLSFWKDTQAPTLQFNTPAANGSFPSGAFTLQVSPADAESGISHVRFLTHSSDWQNGTWQVLGEDWDRRDGWNFGYANSAADSGQAFYAIAYDWAGNTFGAGVWNLGTPAIFLPYIHR